MFNLVTRYIIDIFFFVFCPWSYYIIRRKVINESINLSETEEKQTTRYELQLISSCRQVERNLFYISIFNLACFVLYNISQVCIDRVHTS